MNETPKRKLGWRLLRWGLITLVILATLTAIFYTEENWRGKRAWENYKRELEAKGAVLDWNAYIPRPVPDDQNFFKAPKMTEWFVGRNTTNDLYLKLNDKAFEKITRSVNSTADLITNIAGAKEYLAWSDQFEPDFNLIREALKRPYARMDGNYAVAYEIPMPNFMSSRVLAQVLAQRTKCQLLLERPEKALQELTLLNDSRKWLEAAPIGKPMTLIAAMINVAIGGLYVGAFENGIRQNGWKEPQLSVIQEQLRQINLAPFVYEAFKEEQAQTVYIGERADLVKDFGKVMTGEIYGYGIKKTFTQKLKAHAYDVMPQGWVFQNTVVATGVHQELIDVFDPTEKQIFPKKLDSADLDVKKKLEHDSVFHLLADIAIPNHSRGFQTLAYNQTRVNQAQIVCALERYYLANKSYPETLDALVPQFIQKIPDDIIGGRPLHYHRTEGGKFLLYSIGWNETDDAGLPGTLADVKKGDWVWQYPAK